MWVVFISPIIKKNPIHFNIPKTKPFTFSFILEAVNPDALGVFSVRKPLESLCRYFCITLLLPLLYLVCFYKEEIDSSLIPGSNGAFTIPTQLIQHQKNKKKFGLCNSNIQPTSELGETRWCNSTCLLRKGRPRAGPGTWNLSENSADPCTRTSPLWWGFKNAENTTVAHLCVSVFNIVRYTF